MLNHLEQYLQNLAPQGIALAYSGGVDSTLLLAVLSRIAQKQKFPVVALTMQTVLQNENEIAEAEDLARHYGIEQKIFHFNPFSLEEVRHNREDRCYHCKKAIFMQFADYAKTHGLAYIIDGTNADDLQVYRPGRRALRELGVVSPLAELGISKTQIRQMSAELGLPTASKPAAPCMATRFAYNTLLDDKLVAQAAAGEEAVRQMFPDIRDIRLRVHGNLARLEVSENSMPLVLSKAKKLAAVLKQLGYEFVTLDLEGFRSGCFDARLKGI